jgi:hypothetical protein
MKEGSVCGDCWLRGTVIWPAKWHCLGCDTVQCGRSSPPYQLQLHAPITSVYCYHTACNHNPEDNHFQNHHCDNLQSGGCPIFSCLFNTFVVTHYLHPIEIRRVKLGTIPITIKICMDYRTYHNWVTCFAAGHCSHALLCLCMHCVTLSLDNVRSLVC